MLKTCFTEPWQNIGFETSLFLIAATDKPRF